MACSEKETALREIVGEPRVDAALRRSDAELHALVARAEVFEAASQGLSALSLDTYLLSRGAGRTKARAEAVKSAEALSPEALDLLIVAVCARHRLSAR
jgi:hypothetical protein